MATAQSLSPQQPIRYGPRAPMPASTGPSIDSSGQRTNSTRRRKPSGQSGQSPRIDQAASPQSPQFLENTIHTDPTSPRLPAAPEPPKAPRGPPMAYRNPYENGETKIDRQAPSSKSFAARAGILPEHFSPEPREAGFQEGSAGVDTTQADSRRRSSDQAYTELPTSNGRRGSKRQSRSQGDDQKYETKSPEEPVYNTINTGRAVYHEAVQPEASRRQSGGQQMPSSALPQDESSLLPTRARSQRYSTSSQQQSAAAERSPLQKLELKLNDISKEEKRARMVLAEQRLREREEASGRRASQPGNVPARQSSTSKRVVSSPADAQDLPRGSNPNQRRSQREVPNLQVDTRDPKRQSSDATAPKSSRPVSAMTPAGRTGSRRLSGEGVRFHSDVRDIDDTNQKNAVPVTGPGPKIHRGEIDQGSKIRTGDYNLQPHVIPPQAVQSENSRLSYAIPPQSAAGVSTRKQVGFGTEAANQPTAAEKGHHHFSSYFNRHPKETVTNGPGPARGLDEWKQGGVAFLTVADMKATMQPKQKQQEEEAEYQAWWEQQQSSGSKKRRSQPAPVVDQADGYFDEQAAATTFEPPLLLKCGPLLRYCGMRSETSQNSQPGREVWRGSVMIVTEDKDSSYTSPPTLRLFHQPLQLLPPPPKQFDEDAGEGLDSEYVDPVGGLPKLTRTGGTVYVKPVEDLEEGKDVSRLEDDDGLFEETRTANVPTSYGKADELLGRSPHVNRPPPQRGTGRQVGRYREVKGIRLHAEQGVTFWRFKLEIELSTHQQRIAYRINRGASVGFWVPARGKSMNIMFHSCNGFSMSVDSNLFSGPDPLWRDVLNAHQIKPFHVMLGGGDQIYNDAVMKQTTLFQEWLEIKNPIHKHEAQFTPEMRNELEKFYLDRYSMWFSQGLFGMANSQIPMINLWDDHDIIDGFGSYPHHFMSTPVFSGLGNIAFKYYMLFQQQSVVDETAADEPSWLLGASPGPYINELSRSIFTFLGKNLAFLGLDCRTERMRNEILSEASYDLIFERCHREIIKGETKHLIVLLGVPIAYPRLVWLENVLTSRVLDPVKALGRMGLLGNFMNKFDGGVEILDDLDDHWTAKNHKEERNWFIEELQELAAEKSIRITILGGDVHLAAIGQFFSAKKLGIPKDRDFRYMPNVISSAIVNTPPPDMMADVLNKRNKIHHLNAETDEDMIPMFTHDVDGKPRNNKHLLPKRNWCSIAEYIPGSTPPPTPPSVSPTASQDSLPEKPPGLLQRTLSLGRNDNKPGSLIRRLSLSNRTPASVDDVTSPYGRSDQPSPYASAPSTPRYDVTPIPIRPVSNFHRRPTNLSEKAVAKGAAHHDDHVDLEYGLDISINCEIKQGDPSGSTEQYRLLVPALFYDGPLPEHKKRKASLIQRFASRRTSTAASSYPSGGLGSRAGSRDSWAPGGRNSIDAHSMSSQGSQGPPVQAGLFRRLSNRLSRSNSQTRVPTATAPNLLQKRRQSLDISAPIRTLEPFKPRPNYQVPVLHDQTQTVPASLRSPPSSFNQNAYNPPQSQSQIPPIGQQFSPPPGTTRADIAAAIKPTAFNTTAPIPRPRPVSQSNAIGDKRNARAYSFSESERSSDEDSYSSDEQDTYPVQPRQVPNAAMKNQPRQTAEAPSGRGSGAAKFFGEDLPTGDPVSSGQRPLSHGGYGGIEAYGHQHQPHAEEAKKKGWRKFF